MNAPQVPFPVVLIFYYIYKKHQKGIDIFLSEEAQEQYNIYYDLSRTIIKDSVHKNIFINSICGKFPTQLIRLAGLLQNLHEAFDYVNSINNHRLQTIQQLESDQLLEKKLELNAEFVSNLDEHLNNNLNIVNLTYIHSAYKLLEYFNKTKLILSGFDTKFDFAETSIDVILVKIRDNDMSNNNESTNSVCQSQNLTKKIIQKILLDDKNIDTKMNTLNQSLKGKGARATLIRDIFNLLEHEGIDFL